MQAKYCPDQGHQVEKEGRTEALYEEIHQDEEKRTSIAKMWLEIKQVDRRSLLLTLIYTKPPRYNANITRFAFSSSY